jgi:hypothetical protein
VTRAERAAEAARLRDEEGLNGIQIAKRMGIGRSYAYELLTDPEGVAVRARKDSYRGTCIDCGSPTDGSNGKAMAPERCDPCSRRHVHWRAVLRIVGAIQRFHERYGRVPAATDFNPQHARQMGHHWRVERFYADGDYPFVSDVLGVFGTWNAAVTAAGFKPIGRGYQRNGQPRRARGAHLRDERQAA